MGANILVAEDDPKQAELIRRYLERDGHLVSVVPDGLQAVEHARLHSPDLLVLDIMMPAMDGLDVCRRIAGEDGPAIMLLTARSTENDLLLGLYLGADDYMTKPFSPRELAARVNALLRRARQRERPSRTVYRCGDVVVDRERHELTVRGELVECTPVEFELLYAFVSSPGRVFTRSQLLERIHDSAEYFTERSIDVHIMNLRRKLEESPHEPVHLLTVYGVGYKFSDAAPDVPAA